MYGSLGSAPPMTTQAVTEGLPLDAARHPPVRLVHWWSLRDASMRPEAPLGAHGDRKRGTPCGR